MTIAPESLEHRLASLGAGIVDGDGQAVRRYSVDGKVPTLRVIPQSPEQIEIVLKACAEVGAAAIPWGGGTAMTLGNIPRRVDVAIDLQRFDRLVEHDHANLTATAQAGIKMSGLQSLLGQHNQFFAIDPPHPAQATIGGVVAANTNGPRRMLYGGVRDLVIGMKMVLPTGEQVKAGGKVVKNVAGYDMCKLFVGSLGTLGIITEVTVKMAPLPETAATIVAWGPLAQGAQLIDALFETTLLPAGIALLSPEVAQASGAPAPSPTVAVWAEGFEEAVARHLRDVQALAERLGMKTEILREGAHQTFWQRVRDFGTEEGRLVMRVTVPLGSVAAVVTAIDRWGAPARAAHYVAHAGTGTIWVSLPADATSAGWFPRVGALAQEHGGHAVMTSAPATLKEGIDVWGPAPPSLALMREIKRQFDPHGVLNPGRFVAGL